MTEQPCWPRCFCQAHPDTSCCSGIRHGLWSRYLGDLVTSVAGFVRVTLNASYAKHHRFVFQEKASFACGFICGGCATDGLSNRLPVGGVHPRLMQLYSRVQCYRRRNLIGTEPQALGVPPRKNDPRWGHGPEIQRQRGHTDVTRIPSPEYLLHSSHLG
jgi:hypothetical protein